MNRDDERPERDPWDDLEPIRMGYPGPGDLAPWPRTNRRTAAELEQLSRPAPVLLSDDDLPF